MGFFIGLWLLPMAQEIKTLLLIASLPVFIGSLIEYITIYITNLLGDGLIVQLGLLLTTTLLGVFIFNFPFGKIFSGDSGAYFVFFMIMYVVIYRRLVRLKL